jgi:hypothetical protein
LKKIVVIGIVFVLFSIMTLPAISAAGLPDYTPTKIYRYYGNFPILTGFAADVNNTGNASSNGSLHYHITAQKFLFGIIPLKNLKFESNMSAAYFTPGKTFECTVFYNFFDLYFFSIGFYKLTCTINPHHSIQESNYDNNYIQTKFFRDKEIGLN